MRNLRHWAALGGVLYVPLFIVGNILLFGGATSGDDSPAKFIEYFGDGGNRDKMSIGWIIAGFGLFFFLWFVAALRETVRATEETGQANGDSLLSTVVTIGGTAYAAITMAALGMEAGVRTMSDDTYQHEVFPGIIHAADDAGYVMHATGTAGLAAMIFAASIAFLRSGSVPRWVAYFGLLAGVAALASIAFLPMILWGLWILAISFVLFTHRTPRDPAPATSA